MLVLRPLIQISLLRKLAIRADMVCFFLVVGIDVVVVILMVCSEFLNGVLGK